MSRQVDAAAVYPVFVGTPARWPVFMRVALRDLNVDRNTVCAPPRLVRFGGQASAVLGGGQSSAAGDGVQQAGGLGERKTRRRYP